MTTVQRISRLLLSTAALALISASTVSAHGKGTIVLSVQQVSPGSPLVVRGAKLGNNSSVRLELRGAMDTYNFGRVQTDSAGNFQRSFTVPAGSRPGQYTVAAVAADGDVSAQADLAIVGVLEPVDAHPGMHDIPGMSGMGGAHATAEMMPIPLSVTIAGRVVIISIILLSAGIGWWLVRSTPARREG